MPIGFELWCRVATVYLWGKISEMIRDVSKAFPQSVDVVESLDILAVALLVRAGQVSTLGGGQLFDPIKHARSGLMLLPNLSLGNAPVEHLKEVVRVGVHENGLTSSASGEVGDRGFGGHVLHGIHPDAKVGKKRFGKNSTQFVVDGRAAGRNSIAASVSAEGSEKCTVRRTRVNTMETRNDIDVFLERFQGTNWVGQFHVGQRPGFLHSLRDAGCGVETLVLEEENDPFRAAGTNGGGLSDSGEHGRSKGCAHSCCDGL